MNFALRNKKGNEVKIFQRRFETEILMSKMNLFRNESELKSAVWKAEVLENMIWISPESIGFCKWH